MDRVLVTGGSGLFDSSFHDLPVKITKSLSPLTKSRSKNYHQGCKSWQIYSHNIGYLSPDVVIYTTAILRYISVKKPAETWLVNVSGTDNLVKVCKNWGSS